VKREKYFPFFNIHVVLIQVKTIDLQLLFSYTFLIKDECSQIPYGTMKMKKSMLVVVVCFVGILSACSFEDRFEPNDDSSMATHVEAGTESELGIGVDDQDWFKIGLQDSQIGTLCIEYTYLGSLGNLNLNAYNGISDLLGDSLHNPYNLCPPPAQGEDHLSVLSLSGNKEFFFQVYGDSGAVNGYNLNVSLAPYSDGPDCSAEYDSDECLGLLDNQIKLYHFPFPDPDDGFVGNGYLLETYSTYRWARREVIMYIRYALHEVQQQFPGTNPLGIIDISQRDGLTPGMDTCNLRHPEKTHSQGGNIDVAYYQTGSDNSARIICDAEGGSNDGYYCEPTAVDTHIVDLQRTTYFIAKLSCLPDCNNTRFRVAGVDHVIGPLLEETALQLNKDGIISHEEYNNLSNMLAYGEGWPFHHHHIHLSFKWWETESTAMMSVDSLSIGCGFRFPGDGPIKQ
jgi:hypothetical protein